MGEQELNNPNKRSKIIMYHSVKLRSGRTVYLTGRKMDELVEIISGYQSAGGHLFGNREWINMDEIYNAD